MKKFAVCLVLFFMGISFLGFLAGCGKEEKDQNEFAVGNWTHLRNRAYILLITNPLGEWSSSVRIADVTSKIVKAKGGAKGTWHIDKGQMIFTVTESDVEEIWEKNSTGFFDIVELTESLMHLRDEAGRSILWKRTKAKSAKPTEEELALVVPMGPVAVNLNKNRSNDKDRYLCLNMSLVLKELMPGQEVPPIHPRAREAALIFLSSLVFDDVKDFDGIKQQNKRLVDVLNPYMEGFVKEIKIDHVIVATDADKVEEFIIEHTMVQAPEPAEGEEGKETPEEKK
jgi:flagellar basal body-associated protein FliL